MCIRDGNSYVCSHDLFVLVRAHDKTISGIVTAADLSLQFRTLTEPFLLLSEIETHVRNIVGKKFTAKELGDVQDPNTPREINSVAALMFGEYVRLLQNPETWTRIDRRLDRAIRSEEHTSDLQSVMRISSAVFCLQQNKNINK